MTRLGRLRDCFCADIEPARAMFCTYGFDPAHFEREVLPALFPTSLSSDRQAGTDSSYFYAADQLAQRHDIVVLYDHAEPGRELGYTALRVTTGGGAFHPKVAVLDYGGFIRVIVSSANLTRAGWVGQFETFLFDDLVIGRRHSWSDPLQSFLHQVRPLTPEVGRSRIGPFIDRLALVGHGLQDDLTLASTFDAPLLDVLLDGMPDASSIDVVSPFFEGDGGRGVFDELRERLPNARGRLFVHGQIAADGVLEVEAPEAKITAALASGRWSLHEVLDTWSGDEDGAPRRRLHGKMIALRHQSRSFAMIGSPNLTRMALQHRAPAGNIEVAILARLGIAAVNALIPDHRDLRPNEVRWTQRQPSDETENDGPARWIREVLYWSEQKRLEVRIATGAPALTLTYERSVLTRAAGPPNWECQLELKRSLEIGVSDGVRSDAVPLLIEDFVALAPRGAQRIMTDEEFLEVLAGNADPRPSGPEPANSGDTGAETSPLGQIPAATAPLTWRKVLRALDRLSQELKDEAAFPRGVEFLIRNPSRLRGLLARLDQRVANLTMPAADHAFALHEIQQALSAARDCMSGHAESVALVDVAINDAKRAFDQHRVRARGPLKRQLTILAKESA